MTLSADVRARLDAHLDAVEKALIAAGNSRERRRGVVDDLEAQILDMLAGKSAEPTVTDLEGVLAGLDPPAAYGESMPPAAGVTAAGAAAAAGVAMDPPASFSEPFRQAFPSNQLGVKPRYSRAAIWGLICILLSLVQIPLIGFTLLIAAKGITSRQAAPFPVTFTRVESLMPGQVEMRNAAYAPQGVGIAWLQGAEPVALMPWKVVTGAWVMVLFMPLGFLGTALGWVAFAQIRVSKGTIRGTELALFDGLFYPLLLCAGLAILMPPIFIVIAVFVLGAALVGSILLVISKVAH